MLATNRIITKNTGGAYRDRTGVTAFAELCLNHSAKAPVIKLYHQKANILKDNEVKCTKAKLLARGRVAELVYATDLKSVDQKSCGFKSHLAHQVLFMKKQRTHIHYIAIAFGTVLFWRGIWNLIDRIPSIHSSFMFDIATGTIGLIVLYAFTKSFKNLD